MAKKKPVNIAVVEPDIYDNEVEFDRAADRFIETIKQRRKGLGQPDNREDTLKIAVKILEGRLNQ